MKTVISLCCPGAFAYYTSEQLNSERYCFSSQVLKDGEGKA